MPHPFLMSLFILLAIFCFPLFAQVSVPGQYRNLIITPTGDTEIFSLPPLNNDRLKKANMGRRNGVFTFGQTIPVNIDMNSYGKWSVVQDQDGFFINRWSLMIQSETALSLNILFDMFQLAPSAELYVIGNDSEARDNLFKSFILQCINRMCLGHLLPARITKRV